MTRWIILAFTLAACTPRGPMTDQQACTSQANEDPLVKAIIIKGAGNPAAQRDDQDQLRAAKQDATNACLRNRGVIRGGGVERQKPLT